MQPESFRGTAGAARRMSTLLRRRWPVVAGAAVVLGMAAFALPRGGAAPAPATPVDAPGEVTGDVAPQPLDDAPIAAAESAAAEVLPAVTPELATRPVDPSLLEVQVEGVGADARMHTPKAVRGIYLNAWAAGSAKKRAKLIGLADRTEVNAFVVDVKDATGYLSYASSVPLAKQIGADRDRRIADIRALLAELKAHDIYPIARIVVFRDPVLAEARPEWAIRTKDGEIWKDRYGDVWVDSFNRNVWEYNIAIAREALALGFSEIQWDYVRFPDTPARLMKDIVFPAAEGRTKAEAIREFMATSRDRLGGEFDGAPVTADVFGLTTSVRGDMGIGQDWLKMIDAIDVLLPMVYPSHYVKGSYGIAHPNGDPYGIVKTALEHGVRRSGDVEKPATIRAWLQDFSLGKPVYGPEYVRAQIDAVYDAGLEEWVLWNAASNYTEAALATADGRAPRLERPRWVPEPEPVDSAALIGAPADTISH